MKRSQDSDTFIENGSASCGQRVKKCRAACPALFMISCLAILAGNIVVCSFIIEGNSPMIFVLIASSAQIIGVMTSCFGPQVRQIAMVLSIANLICLVIIAINGNAPILAIPASIYGIFLIKSFISLVICRIRRDSGGERFSDEVMFLDMLIEALIVISANLALFGIIRA